MESLGATPVLQHAVPAPVEGARRLVGAGERLFDVVAAVVLLVVLAPLLACTAIAIKLDSRGPILYRCPRVGLHGREFRMLKFRKMWADASGPVLTVAGDARFTRIGRFLAATKLDELPQLWNVLRGEMRLVGPRPEIPELVWLHREQYAPILEVKPGITGLCQLAFADEVAILDPGDRVGDYVERLLPQKLAIDGLYAAGHRLSTDLRILVWTAVAVVGRRDVAVRRDSGTLSLRRARR